jgi:hypothetical protein
MNNCISYGFYFNINYAFYHIDEPGILFCCSDGCFDYMRSPLHFEWLLLHTLTENLQNEQAPESKGTSAGSADQEYHEEIIDNSVESVQDEDDADIAQIVSSALMNNIYKNIGDDTTMAGWLFHVEKTEQLNEMFRDRIAVIDEQAVKMNGVINSLRDSENMLSDLVRAHSDEAKISELRDLSAEFRQQIGEIWEEYRTDYAAFDDPIERGEF